jgi:hypothetical protein
MAAQLAGVVSAVQRVDAHADRDGGLAEGHVSLLGHCLCIFPDRRNANRAEQRERLNARSGLDAPTEGGC